MKVNVNGEARTAPDGETLAQLLARLGYATPGVAVAVNRTFVPRAQYATCILKENDAVEIVAPMQGG